MANFRDAGYKDGVARSADEKTVGILRYLTPDVPGFHGTIKERFSDFIVHEVALDGQVARLTTVKHFTDKTTAAKEMKISEVVKKRVLGFLEAADTVDGEFPLNNRVRGLVGKLSGRLLGLFNQNKREAATATDHVNIGALKKVVASVCDDDTAERLATYLGVIVNARVQRNATGVDQNGAGEVGAYFFPVIDGKEQRMQIHTALRELCATLVVSDTEKNSEGQSVIRVRPMLVDGRKRKDIDHRSSRTQWPADRPDYLRFVLYKKNMETLAVVSQLARAMGVNQSAFSYAGTKDKRGITTQHITVYRGNEDKLTTINKGRKNLHDFNYIVGDPTYVHDRLNLGDLQGNRFSMAIRSLPDDSQISNEQIDAAVKTWASRGFINYFGLQRFGTRAIATHEVGRAILRKDYKLAIDLLMQPQDGDASKIVEARTNFQETQNVDEAIRSFPPYFIAEHSVLQGFKTHGLTAYAQAIACIPRHLRMMYTHSYQSYVWNVIASERLDQFSSEHPVLGDLVIPQGAVAEEVVDAEGVVADVDIEAHTNEAAPAKKRKLSPPVKPEVILITAGNVDKYSIYDVVLPLPGYDITYPENPLKERYDEIMKNDGVDFFSLNRATNSEYHLPGSYRHVLKKPIDVVHEIKRYNDPTVELLETDVDHLTGKNPQASIENAKSRALCLAFQLGPSSYATMAVRELMKQSSNLNVQLQIMDKKA